MYTRDLYKTNILQSDLPTMMCFVPDYIRGIETLTEKPTIRIAAIYGLLFPFKKRLNSKNASNILRK
jgi:hypothetical protein